MTPSPQGWQPLVLTVAPNGAYKMPADHPALPLSPAQLADCAAACVEAGAAMMHLHVRDRDGGHTLAAEAYRQAMDAITRAVGRRLAIQVTSEAAGRYVAAEQIAAMRQLQPDSMSLAIRELIPDAEHEAAAAEFLQWLRGAEILPQYIVYSETDVQRYAALCRSGVIPDGPRVLLFVLGRYRSGQTSVPADLLPFLGAHQGPEPWAVCAFGPLEHACTLTAACLGGHLRVGFENNLMLKDGSRAADNAALIAQAAAGAAALGRPLADADWLREHWCR